MAKRAKKGSAKSKVKAAARGGRVAPERELQALIGTLIEAKQRGDEGQRGKAARALGTFTSKKVPASLRQVAAEASTVDANPVLADSVRLLGDIAARLGAAKRP